MNLKIVKVALVLGALAAAVGMGLSGQYVPDSWAASPTDDLALAKEMGLFTVPKKNRQQAVAWALVKEISEQLGDDQAQKIQEAHTAAEIYIYLKDVTETCAKAGGDCPVSDAIFAGLDAKGEGVKGKDYGKAIYTDAQYFETYSHEICIDGMGDVSWECGSLECLSWWANHIGDCDTECGGLAGTGFCPDEDMPPIPE